MSSNRALRVRIGFPKSNFIEINCSFGGTRFIQLREIWRVSRELKSNKFRSRRSIYVIVEPETDLEGSLVSREVICGRERSPSEDLGNRSDIGECVDGQK